MSRLDVQPLRGARDDYDSLLELIGDARFVLIGGERYACFERFGGEQLYGHAVRLGISESCREGGPRRSGAGRLHYLWGDRHRRLQLGCSGALAGSYEAWGRRAARDVSERPVRTGA